MATSYKHRAAPGAPDPAPEGLPTATTARDFVTPDGRVVPRALGEVGLSQGTALLVGGMLVGHWPDHL